jgi:hypothetical protein
MALHIAFEKSTDTLIKRLVKFVCGPYVHTELIVTEKVFDVKGDHSLTHIGYTTYMRENFGRVFQKDFWYSDEYHDFLLLPVTPEELFRISKACEACVESKIPYNTTDMILCTMPLRNPTERDLYASKSLFCSQAIVLLLRSCLDRENKLQDTLAFVNSRTVTPTHLYETLKPFCTRRTKAQVMEHHRV